MTSRVLIMGNSGSGKTTMARALRTELGLAHLDLDLVAWSEDGERLPLAKSAAAVEAFMARHPAWVIEGTYAGLIRVALPCCTELRFLNPGVEACRANCRARPWEPQKYDSADAQDRGLPFLLEWVARYETRDDEYGLRAHRAVFDGFTGSKREYGGGAPG